MRRLALLFFVLTLWAGAAAAQEIGPPFGLDWGETPQRLERLLVGAKAKIVERTTLPDGRARWTVEGLVQTNLKKTLFYFRNGGLMEVELQYQNADWVDSDYNNLLTQLRTRLEERYGASHLLARSKSPVGDVTQTLVGYQWAKGSGQIEVIYFAAENPTQVYRTVSLHYRAVY